jgi:hypothetical protein
MFALPDNLRDKRWKGALPNFLNRKLSLRKKEGF